MLYAQDEYVVKIRDKEIRTRLTHTSLSGSRIRKVSLPTYKDDGLAALLDVAALAAGEVPSMRSSIWAPWRLRRDTVLMTHNAKLTGGGAND